MNLSEAIRNAYCAVHHYQVANPATHNYPCGFAWVEFRCRKNAREAKELIANGARWNDYAKCYSLSVSTRTQDMDYNFACCRTFADAMKEAGYEGFRACSRID